MGVNPQGLTCTQLQFLVHHGAVAVNACLVSNRLDQFPHREWFPLDFIDPMAVDQKLIPQQHAKLSSVQFGYQDRFEAPQELA